MIAAARSAAPHECCGLLAGRDGLISHHYPITNVIATQDEAVKATFPQAKIAELERLSPEEKADIAFWMDMKEMFAAQKDMRAKGVDILASYHSHPHSPARLSSSDIKVLSYWHDIIHIVVSLEVPATPVLHAFRIAKDQVTTVPYKTI